jgi:PmbA protein
VEEILELARKVSDEAEIYAVSSEEAPVHFEANRLKAIESKQSTSLSLRIIKNGKLGYAAAGGEIEARKLVEIAVETSEFGTPAKFSFPTGRNFPEVKILDPEVEAVGIGEMIKLGQKLIEPILMSTEGILCNADVTRESITVSVINSRGGKAQYKKTAFGLGVSGTLIRDTDMLFVGEGQESCHPLRDTKAITDIVLHQLELAKNPAAVTTGLMPVIFTPDGVVSAFLPALMSAFNGKTVLLGASPVGKRLGETVFDTRFSLFDDPTLDFAPHSRPCDDEGTPSRRTALIENGKVRNFLYDLQTAGQAQTQSTGSGSRGRGGLMSPAPSAWTISTGRTAFEDMIRDIKVGLVIEQLMGAEQGNVLGGDFSGNVLLGYKVENGEITGRVKNTMVSGNIYQILKEVAAIGKESKWIGGGVCAPAIYCPALSVASK